MTYAGLALKGIMNQHIGKVDKFAKRATTAESPVMHCGNTRTIVASIFQPLQGIQDDWGNFMRAQDANNTTHECLSFYAVLRKPIPAEFNAPKTI
jgi:hypothetical protein